MPTQTARDPFTQERPDDDADPGYPWSGNGEKGEIKLGFIHCQWVRPVRPPGIMREMAQQTNEAICNPLSSADTLNASGDDLYATNVISGGLIGINRDGTITFVNPAAARILGDAPAAMIGQSLMKRALHDPTAEVVERMNPSPLELAIVEGTPIQHCREWFWRQDGRAIQVSCSYQILIGQQGTRTGLVSFADDTTESAEQNRKKQQDDLLKAAQRIARLGSWHVKFGAVDADDIWTLSEELNHMYQHPGCSTVKTEDGFQVMPEEERECIRARWEAAKSGRGPTEWEHRIVINGCMRWMQVRAQFIRDETGRAIEANGINQDITERKNLELARHASEELTHGIMESLHHRIAVLDRNGQIIRTNQAWRSFAVENGANQSTSDGVGLNYFATCLAAEGDPWAARSLAGMKSVLAGELVEYCLEYPCHGPGSQRWYLLQVVPLGEDVRGLVVSHVDITSNKMAALAVAAAEHQLRTIVDALPGLVGYVDTATVYQFNNRTYEEWFGINQMALKGRTIEDVLGKDYFEWARPKLKSALQGVQVSFEARITDCHGQSRCLLVTYIPDLDERGAIRGIFILALDISEQKRTQAALAALAAEMDGLRDHQVATQTAAILAHELNQPLNAAATFCEAASRLLQQHPGADAQTAGVVRRTTEEIQRAGNVVRRLLATLRDGEPPVEILNLAEVLVEATALFRQEAPDLAVTVELETQKEEILVLANRLQLEKVLINLLRNGRDAVAGLNPPSAGVLSVSAMMGNQVAVISVIDNGPCISDAVRHRLFEPFFTTKTHGIGMGLNVSRAIVERLGGQLWHETLEMKTAFNFSLPVAK